MKTIVILSVILIGVVTDTLAQANNIIINAYLYDDTVLFVDTLVIEQQRLKEDKTFFNEIKPKKTLIFETDSVKTVVFLAQDGNLFFIDSSDGAAIVSQKLSMTQIDSFGNYMYPNDIMKVNLEHDENEELLLKYTEAGEPPALFKLSILNLDGEQAKVLVETEPLFPFPSYNPFVKPKDVQIQKSRITIPYCVGCESGKEGKEAEGVMTYEKGTYVFKK